MEISIPAYIEERIRRPAPAGSFIVAGSTPVLSFGNAQTATVATLGLNPSRIEFLDQNDRELVGSDRRLATHRSLGTSDLLNAPLETVVKVLEGCHDYFQRKPYRWWFDQLTPMLTACDASYYNGSACHLDLVQWATKSTWGSLPSAVRSQLLANDSPFLAGQLRNPRLRWLLVNGMSVIRQLLGTLVDPLEEVEPIIGCAHQDTRLFVGTICERVRVVAWSTNIQSSFGVTNELRVELAARIASLRH
jgi:hypothetical protein